MANEILTENLKSATHALGELIKADPRTAALKAAADKYNTSDELNRLITEYNVQQTALSNEYAKDERDEAIIHSIENRMNELYDEVTGNATYSDYVRAKEEYDALYNEVLAEIEFAITGNRPCAHDCSCCGGGCHEH